MRWHPTPKAIVTGVLSLTLVSLLLSFSDFKVLLKAILLPGTTIAGLFGLMLPYLAAKWIVWLRLLRQAGIDAPWPDVFFSYMGGEMTKSLPGGIYFQNYLLSLLSGHRVAEGVATSTVLVGMEAAVTMAMILMLGIPGWPWVRPLMVCIALGWIVLLFSLWRFNLVARLRPWADRGHPMIARLLEQAHIFSLGLKAIWHPLLWLELILLSAIYLVAAGSQLFLIAYRLDPHALSFGGANAAHAFSLLLPLMSPIPIQIGFAELTGTGALMAEGIPRGIAISLIFAFRLWNNGLVYPIALPVMLAMRSRLHQVLRGRQEPPKN